MDIAHRKTGRRISALLLLAGLAGCYYPVYQPCTAAPYPYPYAPPAAAASPLSPGSIPPGQECREYHMASTVAGQAQTLVGTACRQSDGSWRDAVNGSPVVMPR